MADFDRSDSIYREALAASPFGILAHDADGKIEYHYVLLDFLCEAGPGEPAPASDALNCAFVPIEDLPRFILTAGTEQAILRAYSLNRGARHPVYDPTY